ncbi:MAG: type II secretion system GspH family protein [Betaproteobacteria bacterium]|nr:type II secretion system GspH family protein [Betaproteobacteria bacterium]
MRLNLRSSSGFTLLELAIVLFVLTLLVGRFALPLAAQREARQVRQAEAEMMEIRAALLGYAVLYGHLPCPDVNGGGEAGANCATGGEGGLPYKTLGLARGDDPWGKSWRYRVDRNFANIPIRFDTAFADSLQIYNLYNEKLSTDEERPVFILISAGPNGRLDGDNAVASDRYQSGAPAKDFDDLVFWLSRPVLFHHLLMAGRVN